MRIDCRPHQADATSYGKCWHNGKMELTHRVAYCQHNGCTLASIAGKVVRHTCDYPPCVNGEHLVLGTQADNMQDKVDRKRQQRGERVHTAKLTEEQVRCIRSEYEGGWKQKDLAQKYGVNQSQISRAINSKAWR